MPNAVGLVGAFSYYYATILVNFYRATTRRKLDLFIVRKAQKHYVRIAKTLLTIVYNFESLGVTLFTVCCFRSHRKNSLFSIEVLARQEVH